MRQMACPFIWGESKDWLFQVPAPVLLAGSNTTIEHCTAPALTFVQGSQNAIDVPNDKKAAQDGASVTTEGRIT